MARQAKKLAKEEGILSLPQNRKISFSQETVHLVLKFHKDEEVSRIIPGKKDYKAIKE